MTGFDLSSVRTTLPLARYLSIGAAVLAGGIAAYFALHALAVWSVAR